MKLQEKEIKDDNYRGELLSIHSRLKDKGISQRKASALKEFQSLGVQRKKLLTLSPLSHFIISLQHPEMATEKSCNLLE